MKSLASRLALVTALTLQRSATSAQPNILFNLADDLGSSDTTQYGATSYYQTPNLERLALGGRVFTRTYSDSPLCSPTRSALPTGVQGKPQSVPFELASRHWQELSIDVPATGPLGIVRVDLPQQVEPIQIDWMEIHSADSGKLTLAEF